MTTSSTPLEPESLEKILTRQLNTGSLKKDACNSIFEIASYFDWEKQREFLIALYPTMAKAYRSLNKDGVKKQFAQLKDDLVGYLDANKNGTELLLGHFQKLVEPPAKYPGNILTAPVIQLPDEEKNPDNISKLSLRKSLEQDTYIDDCAFVGAKTGGANKPGPLGGFYIRAYMTKDGKVHAQKGLIKQATDHNEPVHRENMAEVIGGRLMNRLAGDHIASTFFTFPKRSDKGKGPNAAQAYVFSVLCDGYEDLNEAAHKAMGVKPIERGKGKGGGQEINSKPRILSKLIPKFGGSNFGGTPAFQPGLERVVQGNRLDEKQEQGKVNAKGLAISLMANCLVGNTQFHTQNEAIIKSQGKWIFAGIDFGGSFRGEHTTIPGVLKPETKETGNKFERVIHPEESEGRKYGVAYFLAYPASIRYSKDFIEGIDEIANMNPEIIKKGVDEEIDYAVEFYGAKDFIEYFAKNLDKNNEELDLTKGNDKEKVAATKVFLKNTLLARQLSLKEFAIHSKLQNIKQGEGFNNFKLIDLQKDHPVYFAFKAKREPEYKKNFTDDEKALLSFLDFPNRDAGGLEKLINRFNDKLEKVLSCKEIELEDRKKIESLKDFFAYINNNNYYDFKNKNDQEVLIQACDEAYRTLKSTLNKVPETDPIKREILLMDSAAVIQQSASTTVPPKSPVLSEIEIKSPSPRIPTPPTIPIPPGPIISNPTTPIVEAQASPTTVLSEIEIKRPPLPIPRSPRPPIPTKNISTPIPPPTVTTPTSSTTTTPPSPSTPSVSTPPANPIVSGTIPASSASTTQMVARNLEKERIQEQLTKRGVTYQEVANIQDKELQKTVRQINGNGVYIAGDSSEAKGAAYAERKTGNHYEIIPLKPPNDTNPAAKLANAYNIIAAFVKDVGYGQPLYIHHAKADELKFYLAICDANNIKAYDKDSKLLDNADLRDSSLNDLISDSLKQLQPPPAKLDNMTDSIQLWLQKTEDNFIKPDKLQLLDQRGLLTAKGKLESDKSSCDSFLKNVGEGDMKKNLETMSARLQQTIQEIDKQLESSSSISISNTPKVRM